MHVTSAVRGRNSSFTTARAESGWAPTVESPEGSATVL